MGSRTTPSEIHPVPSLPRTAQIYRIGASPYWQFRYFVDGRYVRTSTKETDRTLATAKAKEIFRQIIVKQSSDVAIHPTRFGAVAKKFLEWQELQVNLGRLKHRTHNEDVYKLQKDILPFFQTLEIATISKGKIDDYLKTLSARNLSKSTLSKHILVIRKVLVYAADEGLLKALPHFPSIGADNKARAYFDLESFHRLSDAAQRYADRSYVADYKLNGRSVRKLRYDQDFSDFIVFSVNCFIRVSDLKVLRHKHIKIINEVGKFSAERERYLEIFPPNPKTTDRSSVTMERAVDVYKALLKRHQNRGFGRPDDFVFYPEHTNRAYAFDIIRRLFSNLLKETQLSKDERGRARTLYSLRHTALMFRFLYGDNINIFSLAMNALTSVEMLEKFYLSHAQSKMKIKELQSFKDGIVYYYSSNPKGWKETGQPQSEEDNLFTATKKKAGKKNRHQDSD